MSAGAPRPSGPASRPSGPASRPSDTASWLSDYAESWPVVASDVVAKSSIVNVRRDRVRMPDGQEAERDVVEHPGAVAVLAMNDDNQVLLIRQYRHPIARQLWEIPAGLRDVPGEPLEETARRELLEEAGYLAADWHVLTDIFTSPGFSTERLRVFLARELTHVPEAERDYVPNHEEAHLEVEWAPLDVVVSRFLAGELHNGVTAVGALAAYVASQGGFAGLRGTDAPEH